MPKKGQHMTEEQRQKIRASRSNLTPEQRENIAAAQRGKTASEETKAKMRAAHRGHQVSSEARAAIGNAHRGKVLSAETRSKISESKTNPSQEVRDHLSAAKSGENHPCYGKHLPEETRLKISASNMGRPKSPQSCAAMSESKKGIVPANIETLKTSLVGKPMSEEHYKNLTASLGSEETRAKMSVAQRGENNPQWRGGVTPLYKNIRECAKYYEWRDAVYKRDDYCDVITGERGNGNLNAHHITPFAEIIEKHHITTFDEAMACDELWDVSNGITMMEVNHILYHARTGKPE
jgi:hypothetical protein